MLLFYRIDLSSFYRRLVCHRFIDVVLCGVVCRLIVAFYLDEGDSNR